MSDTVRIGIIGVGQIGKAHLNRYKSIPGVEVVAAVDIDEPELARVAGLFEITDTYTDFRKMLERDDIQAVDVCLHNNLHMPATVASLEAGKDVYCEKPITGSYIDGEKMVQTAKQLGRKLAIQLSTLFSKETKAAKALIDEGMLGHIYHARSTGFRRRGRPYVDGYGSQAFVQKETAAGGALFDMGVYHISCMLYLLGNPDVQRVSGKTYQETSMNDKRRQASGYNVEELGLGFVRFAGDATMDIVDAWAIHLDGFEGSSIVGSKGGIRLNPFGFYQSIGDLDLNATVGLDSFERRLHTVQEIGDVYDSPQHHWIAAQQGRVELLPTADITLNTMLISEGIYLSSKLGREVTADEVREQSVSSAVKM